MGETQDDHGESLTIADNNSVGSHYADTRPFWRRLVSTMGPGLMVCFADTDGSCLLTAADSGYAWRYKLLMLQAVLIPILYVAQELAVRLALVRGRGLTALVRFEGGARMGWVVAVPLLFDCFLALISEINVLGQTILACWDVPLWLTNTIFTLCLILLALTGSYSVAEKVGLAMGFLQVFFFATIFMANPVGAEVWEDLGAFPLQEASFMKLVTANIGAVIMPWMLAYQQSALCEKGKEEHLGPDHLLIERIDTGIGSFLTQGVMASVLITVAAAKQSVGTDIENMKQFLTIFAYVMGGELRAKIALTFAVCGACIVAAIVVTLCGSWALEEAMGRDHERQEAASGQSFIQRVVHNVRQRPIFYVVYVGTCTVAWFITVALPDFANALTGVTTQFINGILMPPVVFSLWYLSAYKLPEPFRLGFVYKWSLFAVFFVCSAFCVASIPFAIGDAVNG